MSDVRGIERGIHAARSGLKTVSFQHYVDLLVESIRTLVRYQKDADKHALHKTSMGSSSISHTFSTPKMSGDPAMNLKNWGFNL